MNDVLCFTAEAEIQAADSGKPARVSIMAYSGGAMDVANFGSVAIDLAGLSMPATIPLLGDHVSTLDGVAGSGSPRIVGGALYVDGTIASNETGQRIIALSRDGVPLQASVGVSPAERVSIRANEEATVNGKQIKAGPRGLTVIKAGSLKEVSILPLGADSSTSVQIAAKGKTMPDSDATLETQDDPIQQERARVKEIRAVCGKEYVDIMARALDEGWTVETVKATVLDKLRARAQITPGVRSPGENRVVGNPRDMLAASCMLMGGHGQAIVKAFPNGEMLANSTPRPSGWPELCATALRLEGLPVPHDRSELVKAGFSTTSLPVALGSSVEKVAMAVFMEQSQNYLSIARVVSAQNFRPGKAVRLVTKSGFQKVGPAGELKHGSLTEDAFTYQCDTYGEIFMLTRQDIINDDAGILADLPMVMGNDSSRKVADVFFGELIANTGSYFSATPGHGNLLDGELGVTELAAAVAALRTQKDAAGRIIGFTPAVLLVPAALEADARALLFSQTLSRVATGDNLPTASPLQNLNLALAVEARLDADSTAAWYLFSLPLHGAILLATLNGRLGPIVEQAPQEAETLGLGWRAFFDFGVSLAEFRAAVKSVPSPS